MNLTERKQRILARGEHSNHSHIVVGDVEFDAQGRIIVGDDSNAILRHLLESEWMNGNEVWTGEHHDIKLNPGVYEPIIQQVFDPLTKRIENAQD